MSDFKRNEYVFRKIETRVDEKQEGGKKLVLRGYPILFNTETKIYDFWYGEIVETILPTALEKTNLTGFCLLVGHNPDNLLQRVGSKIPFKIEIDNTGLFFEAELPNTQLARDTYNLIESEILDGMSFGFRCSDEVNLETMKRTITQIDELYEITITPFPAYKEASVVAQKNIEKNKQKNIIDKKLKELEDM